MKLFFQIACIASLIALSTSSHAQATPTASRIAVMQIGVGWSIADPDYAQRKVQGFSIYGDIDFSRHWGIEGDIHRASSVTPTNVGVDSYLLGPRYVFHYRRFNPYGKVLFGLGRFKYIFENASTATYSYKIYALGGGLDYQATRRINIRAIDFEYQKWPGYGAHGLSPINYTFGAAYVF